MKWSSFCGNGHPCLALINHRIWTDANSVGGKRGGASLLLLLQCNGFTFVPSVNFWPNVPFQWRVLARRFKYYSIARASPALIIFMPFVLLLDCLLYCRNELFVSRLNATAYPISKCHVQYPLYTSWKLVLTLTASDILWTAPQKPVDLFSAPQNHGSLSKGEPPQTWVLGSSIRSASSPSLIDYSKLQTLIVQL